ncbi:DUF4280 domain-containing protein [Chryseobacterium bernardetii]|uniref:DUF4280 domain-containing protein n=1 Tax=Chryseobacterium bernardetii TaxID=1241978 RepID=A0A3G6TAG7_9FLAO|nr:polymorphic toxin-type HINT domain-containing protein [Chryseobacterium bernardetii]AZB26252.1 DUF4280 domain-containing protein [Chryseobacterium bernardetii]
MDELEYITLNALMMCDQGAAPDFFKPTFNTKVKIHGCLVATNQDATPLINIPSFKVCKISGGPCTPATVPMTWQDTWQVKINGIRSLIGKSTCQCPVGGKIEFMTSGQVPLPDDAAQEVKDMQDQAQRELDDSGHGDSVGEAGFVEGMIPVWGSGRDLINDIQTGDVGGSLMNAGFLIWDVASIAVGVVSFGTGTVAMQGAKAGVKGAIKAGAKAISKEALQQMGKAALKKLSKEALKKSVDDVAKKLLKTCVFACFPAGTPVHTKDGIKNIEDIRIGDLVWAYDEDTDTVALQPVIDLITNESDHTISIYTEAEVIETTAIHPFYTNGEWIDASELKEGDKILLRDQQEGVIQKTEFNYTPQKVYNFEVDQWHNYFVGDSGVLVHNSGKCLSKMADEAAELVAKTWDDLAKLKHCFPAGTLVKIDENSGYAAIETISVGDYVTAFDQDKHTEVLKQVTGVYVNHTESLCRLYIGDEIIESTSAHRFWSLTHNDWINAEDIESGNLLMDATGKSVIVEKTEKIAGNFKTYNLEVDEVHNYFVSSLDILVHNGKSYPNSIFHDLTTRSTEIYRYFDPVTGETLYVGKTVQGVNKRASQHALEKGLQNLIDEEKLAYEVIDRGNWNAFQTAAHEQHYISKFGTKGKKAGAVIWNKINALSAKKFNYFSKLIGCGASI